MVSVYSWLACLRSEKKKVSKKQQQKRQIAFLNIGTANADQAGTTLLPLPPPPPKQTNKQTKNAP